jgi:hypothetical protein
MSNPPNSYPNPSSYLELLRQITQHMQQIGIHEQLLEMVQQVFEKELGNKHLVLSPPEKARLLEQVTRAVLTEALGKIGSTK